MQNLNYRTRGNWRHWRYTASGQLIYDTLTPSSSEFIIRTQTGYTGARPKVSPMPPHSYTFNFQHITCAYSGAYYYSNKESEFAEGPYLSEIVGGATYLPAYTWDALESKALDVLNQKVRGDLDLSVDLAEAGKTKKMLSLSNQVVDYTNTFQKRFGPLKAASNLWLTYQYGVKPLLGSIYNLAEENLRVVINKTAHLHARASGTYVPKEVIINTIHGQQTMPVTGGGPIKTSVTYGVDVRTDQFDLARFSSLNPVSIAWELTPYSFVVDWFYNVGGYLRNMETYLLYANKFRSGYRTRLSAGSTSFLRYEKVRTSGETSDVFKRGTVRHIAIDRYALVSYPSPTLPSLSADLGSSRLVSAAALLGQMLGR